MPRLPSASRAKKPPKKRTRRAVKARRTLEEQEAAAEKKLTEWEAKLDAAISKVQFYRKELKQVRKKRARKIGDDVFGDIA